MDDDSFFLDPRKWGKVVIGGSLAAGVFSSLLALLSRTGWYQDMGAWLRSNPLAAIGIIGAACLIGWLFIIFVRARTGEDEDDDDDDEAD